MPLRAAGFTFHAWINPCSVFATFVTEGNLGSGAEMRPLIFNQQLLASKFDLCPMKIEGKCQFEESDVITGTRFSILGEWLYSFESHSAVSRFIVYYRDDSSYCNLLLTVSHAIRKKMRITRMCIINSEVHVTARRAINGISLITKFSSHSLRGLSNYIFKRDCHQNVTGRLIHVCDSNSCLSVYIEYFLPQSAITFSQM